MTNQDLARQLLISMAPAILEKQFDLTRHYGLGKTKDASDTMWELVADVIYEAIKLDDEIREVLAERAQVLDDFMEGRLP